MNHRTDHATAEHRFRALLDRSELPAPDEVAYLRDSLVFCWHESRAIVVVDLEDPLDELPEPILGGAAGDGFGGLDDGDFVATG